jgi:hypothetical protein
MFSFLFISAGDGFSILPVGWLIFGTSVESLASAPTAFRLVSVNIAVLEAGLLAALPGLTFLNPGPGSEKRLEPNVVEETAGRLGLDDVGDGLFEPELLGVDSTVGLEGKDLEED